MSSSPIQTYQPLPSINSIAQSYDSSALHHPTTSSNHYAMLPNVLNSQSTNESFFVQQQSSQSLDSTQSVSSLGSSLTTSAEPLTTPFASTEMNENDGHSYPAIKLRLSSRTTQSYSPTSDPMLDSNTIPASSRSSSFTRFTPPDARLSSYVYPNSIFPHDYDIHQQPRHTQLDHVGAFNSPVDLSLSTDLHSPVQTSKDSSQLTPITCVTSAHVGQIESLCKQIETSAAVEASLRGTNSNALQPTQTTANSWIPDSACLGNTFSYTFWSQQAAITSMSGCHRFLDAGHTSTDFTRLPPLDYTNRYSYLQPINESATIDSSSALYSYGRTVGVESKTENGETENIHVLIELIILMIFF